MANKISVVLDVATDKAISGLKGFKQSVAEADGAFGKVKAGAGSAFDSIKANAGLAGVAVVGAVGAMAAKSIEAASRLGESINAVNVTFGESAAGIKALGEEAAESVGLSNSAFNGLAVQFSSFADTIAGKGGDVVGTIDDMTTRAADFASVMNIDVADAATIFQSGLAGETEPLKKFGIDLSAATVEAYALSEGIIAAGETMTEAQKIQARYGLLMEKTEKTAGDFANTSGGLANSQRILAAKMEDTAAKVGERLAPALAKVTSALSDMIPIAGTAAVKIGGAFDSITEKAYDLGAVLADVAEKIPGITLSGEGMEVENTLHDLEQMEAGAADLVTQYAKAGMTTTEFRDALSAAGVEFAAANFAINAYAKQLDGTSTVTGEVIDVTEDLTEAVDRTAQGEEEAAEMIEQVNKTFDEQVEAAEAATEALEDQIDALTALVGGDIAVRDAQREAAAAMAELTTAMDDGDVSAEELAAQQDVTASALINSATAAADYAEEQLAANGAVLDAQGKQDLLRQKLIEVAATLAPGSPLLTQIQGYIDALNLIPRDVDTRIRATGGGTTVGPLPRFGIPTAAGGQRYAGQTLLVGEQGPELVTMGGDGYVTPNHALNGNGGGGAPVYVTVNAGMGADGREIGDIIVGKIREYERRNGNGWRG